jgi:hypothetical protein
MLSRNVLFLPSLGAYATSLYNDSNTIGQITIDNGYYYAQSRANGPLSRYDNAFVSKQTVCVSVPDTAPFQLNFLRMDREWPKINAGIPTKAQL